MKFGRAFMAAFTIICLLVGLVAFLPQATLATDAEGAHGNSEANSSVTRDGVQPTGSLSADSAPNAESNQDAQERPSASAPTSSLTQQSDSGAPSTQGQPQQQDDESQTNDPEPVEEWYVDERSDSKTILDPIPITSETRELKAGFYIVREDVELEQALWVSGKACMIVAKDAVLSIPEGIRVRKDATLSLYAQGDSAGSLVIRKGVKRFLTDEQKKKEEDEDARKREKDPSYVKPEPQLLYVWPCLDVTAGDHEPCPNDDEDPEHAPKREDKPKLNDALLHKDYLVIQPRVTHDMEDKDGYYECVTCGQTFEDQESHLLLSPEQVQVISEVQAATDGGLSSEASSVIISFDPNGGEGSMDPLEVDSGQSFELPECTFTPPEGKVFSSWSLGMPGSVVAVPTSTTVKAWWIDVPSEKGEDEKRAEDSQSTGARAQSGSQADGSQNETATSASSNPTSTSSSAQTSGKSSPPTGDRSVNHSDAMVLCLISGAVFIALGKAWR